MCPEHAADSCAARAVIGGARLRSRRPYLVAAAVRLPVILCALWLGGCASVQPWERGRLAHPNMSAGRSGGPGEAHLHAVHEGATGGAVGAESGCGCN